MVSEHFLVMSAGLFCATYNKNNTKASQKQASLRTATTGFKGMVDGTFGWQLKFPRSVKEKYFPDPFDAEIEIQPKMTVSSDYKEARAAFTEKRAPKFIGA